MQRANLVEGIVSDNQSSARHTERLRFTASMTSDLMSGVCGELMTNMEPSCECEASARAYD
jgi:hypothetical protein